MGAPENSPDANHRLFRFLFDVDRYLQWFTLRVTEEAPRQPEYTTHEFRGLPGFKIKEGCTTSQSPVVPIHMDNSLPNTDFMNLFCSSRTPLCSPTSTPS